MLEKIIKALPLISIAVILLGIYNMTRFYSWYDIQIFSYVDASEILLFFTNLIVVLLILIALIIISSAFIQSSSPRSGSRQVLREQKGDESNFDYSLYKRRQLRMFKRKILLMVLLVLTLLNGVTIYSSRDWTEPGVLLYELLWLLMLLFNVGFSSLVWLSFYVGRYREIKANWNGIEWKMLLASLPFLLIYFEARNYKYFQFNMSKSSYDVTIHFNKGDSLSTNKNFIYISSTKNYIFFRNKSDSTTTIIPKGECKRIQIRDLR